MIDAGFCKDLYPYALSVSQLALVVDPRMLKTLSMTFPIRLVSFLDEIPSFFSPTGDPSSSSLTLSPCDAGMTTIDLLFLVYVGGLWDDPDIIIIIAEVVVVVG
jgi:hypothetical protein